MILNHIAQHTLRLDEVVFADRSLVRMLLMRLWALAVIGGAQGHTLGLQRPATILISPCSDALTLCDGL
jgi:hypothetical protein